MPIQVSTLGGDALQNLATVYKVTLHTSNSFPKSPVNCINPMYAGVLLQIYPCYFTPVGIFLSGQMQHSLETQNGSVPIIAIVAIFIALNFSRVENFCLFLLLLSHIQLHCKLIHSAKPDRAPLYHKTGT